MIETKKARESAFLIKTGPITGEIPTYSIDTQSTHHAVNFIKCYGKQIFKPLSEVRIFIDNTETASFKLCVIFLTYIKKGKKYCTFTATKELYEKY